MSTFESDIREVDSPCQAVFDFLKDFRNFEKLLPEQVQNWQATAETCSFRIQGVADLAMRIAGTSACRNIHMVSDGETPVAFSLDFFLNPSSSGGCRISCVLEAELSPFVKMLASRPLQAFVDKVSGKLQEVF